MAGSTRAHIVLALTIALFVTGLSTVTQGKTYPQAIAELLARPGVRYVVVVPYLGEGLGADYDRTVAGWRQLAETYREIGARFVVIGFSTGAQKECHYPKGWEPTLKICDRSGEALARWQKEFGQTGAQVWLWKGKSKAPVMDLSGLGKTLLSFDESPGVVQVVMSERASALVSDEVLLPAITGSLAGWSKMTVLGLGDETASDALSLFNATSAAARRAPCEWDFSDKVAKSVLLVGIIDGANGRSLRLSWHLAERGCHVASTAVLFGQNPNYVVAGETAVEALMSKFHAPGSVVPWLGDWELDAGRLAAGKSAATSEGWNLGDDEEDSGEKPGPVRAPKVRTESASASRSGGDPRKRLPDNVVSLAAGPLIAGLRGGHFEFELDFGAPGEYFVLTIEAEGGAEGAGESVFKPGGTIGYRTFFESGIWNLLLGLQVMKHYVYGEWEYEYNVVRLKALMGYHVHQTHGASWGLDFGAALGYQKMLRVGEYGELQDGSEEDFSGFAGELYFMGRVLF